MGIWDRRIFGSNCSGSEPRARTSAISPNDFVWAINMSDPDVLLGAQQEKIGDLAHGAVVGGIQTSRLIDQSLTALSAREMLRLSVFSSDPGHFLIEQPGGFYAVDGRLTSLPRRLKPDGKALGGSTCVSFCGVFAITDPSDSFWLGGTGPGVGDNIGKLTFRYRYDGTGFEMAATKGATTDTFSFMPPPGYEPYKVQAMIFEYDFVAGEYRAYHHSDSVNEFAFFDSVITGQVSDVEVDFNSTPYNHGLGGIAYCFTIYDRKLTAEERGMWFDFADATFNLDRDVRFPLAPPGDSYGVIGCVIWLDAFDSATLFEDEIRSRMVRDQASVKVWQEKSTNTFEGVADSTNIQYNLSANFLEFSSGYFSFGDQSSLFRTDGMSGFAVARFDVLDSGLLIANFSGGSSGTFYFGVDADGRLGFTTIADGGGRVDLRDGSFSSNEFHLFEWGYDGSEVWLRVDGSLLASAPQSGTIQSATSDLRVGAYQTGWKFDGGLAEILVFNRHLEPAERSHIFDELSAKHSALLGT